MKYNSIFLTYFTNQGQCFHKCLFGCQNFVRNVKQLALVLETLQRNKTYVKVKFYFLPWFQHCTVNFQSVQFSYPFPGRIPLFFVFFRTCVECPKFFLSSSCTLVRLNVSYSSVLFQTHYWIYTVNTRRCLDVVTTLLTSKQRCTKRRCVLTVYMQYPVSGCYNVIDVQTTLYQRQTTQCAYWVIPEKKQSWTTTLFQRCSNVPYIQYQALYAVRRTFRLQQKKWFKKSIFYIFVLQTFVSSTGDV